METPEEKWPLGKPRCIWEDNIKMDLMEKGCDVKNSIDLAEDRSNGGLKGANEPLASLKYN